MVSVTHYTSDIHGNIGHVRASSTVLNYLNKKLGVDAYRCNAGDDTSQASSVELQQGNGQRKQQETAELDEAFAIFTGEDYRVDGNHDLEQLTAKYKTVETVDTFDIVEIGGKKHLFIYNTSADMFGSKYGSEEENKKYLDDRKEELKRLIREEGIDTLVWHEDESEEFGARQNRKKNKVLAEVVESTGVNRACGHVHGSKMKDYGDHFVIRTCAESDTKSTYFRVIDEEGDSIYEVKNSDLAKVAQSINPNIKYTQKGVEEEKKEEEKKVIDFIKAQDPTLLEEQDTLGRDIRAAQRQFRQNARKNKTPEEELTRDDLVDFIAEQNPALIDKQKDLNKRRQRALAAYKGIELPEDFDMAA